MKSIVKQAKLEDLAEIYELVKELAIYEKAGDQVTATLKDYQNDFKEGLFEAIVLCKDNGEVIGMMLYYMTYSTWKGKMLYLEDFVIKKAYRKQGLGQVLYNRLLSIAKQKKVKLVKWQVLDWNTPAINFYQKNKAIIEKEWYNVKVFTNN